MSAGFQFLQRPPEVSISPRRASSSSNGTIPSFRGGLNGFVSNSAAPGYPSARARSARFVVVLLWRIMWSWSSNTKRSDGGPSAANASDSNIAVGLTLKKRPKTSFIARKVAAMPPVLARNFRRLMPSFLAAPSASSFVRASTRCCSRVCGIGIHSPFDTI